MELQALLSRLGNVRPTSTGYTARCPAHDDRINSLSLKAEGDRILVYCHAGCSPDEVTASLGLTLKDLFSCDGRPKPGPRRRIVATYDYRDEEGRLVFQVVRTEPKGFYQRQPDGTGGWTHNLKGVCRVPYRLHTLVKTRPRTIYIVEGEKDVDHLWSLGLPATCNPGGAGKWHDEYTETLVKLLGPLRVAIFADHDAPGRAHAVQVARSFWGRAEVIKLILTLPGVSEKGDVSDYLDAGHPKEGLSELVEATPPLTLEELEQLEREYLQQAKSVVIEEPDEGGEDEAALLVFPEVAWRGVFDAYRRATAGTSECSEVFRFSTFWALVATRLRRRVWIDYAYPHFPNVYLLNFAETGEAKTTPMRQATHLIPQDGRVKMLRGRASGEALADWLTQPEDGAPVSHLMILEELATLLVSGRWEGATIVPFLTEVFDCPDHYDLKYRKNPVLLREPTVSILAGTTPEWFWKTMKEVDIHGGFGNRFLYLTGSSQAPISMPAKPDSFLLGEVKRSLDTLDALEPCECFLTPDALALWDAFYKSWRTTEFEPLTKAATKRIPAYILKLTMAYASLEKTVPTITADQLISAIAVGHYAAECANLLMGQHRQASTQGRCEARILKVLDRPMARWQVHRRISGEFTAEEVRRAFVALEHVGRIRQAGTTRRGEPLYERR